MSAATSQHGYAPPRARRSRRRNRHPAGRSATVAPLSVRVPEDVLASRDEVYEQVREILVERLDIDEADVTQQASLRDDLKADSLDLVELIMDLEERFAIKISDDEAQSIATVGDAVDFIVARAE